MASGAGRFPVLAAAMLVCCSGGTAHGQSLESDVTPESEHLLKAGADFAMSSVIPDDTLAAARIDDEQDRFSVKFGFVVMPMDYTSFEQDARSRQQVGNQQDEWEARSLRLSARGHFEMFRTWNYMVSYEYKGFDQTSTSDWNTTDVRVSTRLGPRLGTLTLGRIKEPHVYEMVGDAANLPHNERLLSPFFRSRNVGATLGNTMLEQRGTWAVGWYNDWWTEGRSWSGSGNDFAGRITALPVWSGDGATYLHMAASTRYYGAVDDQLRYRGKPASNVADDYVDTGRLPGDHSWHTGVEALWNHGGYSVLAEYVRADLSTLDGSDPTLDGWYVTGSWVVTGEHRPYDRKAGYSRRVLPQGRWGAVEIIARVGEVDLDDRTVRGGTMQGWWTGVNWWANNRWKASVGYGSIDLDRFGIEGNTKTLLTRLQWIY
jgi:phosphate-selective porin OprO and OprP